MIKSLHPSTETMPIKIILPASLFIAVVFLVTAEPASAGHGKFFTQTGCACCPVCDHVCKLDAEQVDEEKTCFEVESKVICIPRVVFPWQRSKRLAHASCDSCDGKGCTACVHNGARIRKVCVLKTEKYKCPACKYTWTAEKKDTCGDGCCQGGPACDGGCICEGSCDGGYIAPAPDIEHATEADPTLPPAQHTVPAPMPTDNAADYFRPAKAPVSSKLMPLARFFK
jgi:hypothetical protein